MKRERMKKNSTVVFNAEDLVTGMFKSICLVNNSYICRTDLSMTEEEKKIRRDNRIKLVIAAFVAVGAFFLTSYLLRMWLGK